MSAWAPTQLRRSMLLGSARLLRAQPRSVCRVIGSARGVFGKSAASFPSARPACIAFVAGLSRGLPGRAKDTRTRQFVTSSPAPSSDEPSYSERLVLVDGMSALYRCHYALEADERRAESEGAASDPAAAADLPHIPPLTMEEATRARCVAFLHYLCTLQSRTRCSHLAVALDARGKNFRHELFNAYKSHRPPVPREVAASAQLLREALPEVGVPFLQVHGVEADDIIGTIAVHACQRGMDVLISSADRDYYQLLRPGLSLLRSTKGSLVPEQAYTHEDFEREWALRPAQYLDFLALQGDRSDNIPGMPGVGVKTALTLLRRHGCLDAFLEAAVEAGAGESRKTGLAQEAGSGASESIAPAEGRVPRRNLAPPSAPSPPLSAWEARATRAAADPQTAHTVRLSRRLATILTSLDIPATRGGLGELAVRRPADGGAAARRTLRALGAGHLVERWQLAWRE